MKRFWIALLGAGLFATAAFAGGDEVPVRMHELPDAAKTLVKKYFHDIEVVSSTMERSVAPSYEVKRPTARRSTSTPAASGPMSSGRAVSCPTG